LTPRITVGLPVYKGADLIGKALTCLQQQTFSEFEAIISVDGNDLATAAACRPFLADSRFRMVIHPERLDWVGNFNWLLQQDLREFFCYRQHDDTTAPEFFEILLQAADKEPNAAAIFSDCQYGGGKNHLEIAPSIEGEQLDRMLQCIQWMPIPAIRGLIRGAAIRHTGLVRTDELRAVMQVFAWLAKLSRWGSFRRIAKPLYYRLDHPRSFSNANISLKQTRAVLTTLFTGFLEAAMPLCRTPQERRFFQRAIADQVVAKLKRLEPGSSLEELLAECLERLRYEGNTYLLSTEEVPQILQGLRFRQEVERSQMRKVIYRIRQQSQMARFIYPSSRSRRIFYQIRSLFGRTRQKINRINRLFAGSGEEARAPF
jgi:glycosyltransferase involved in cell wall biosynthesis